MVKVILFQPQIPQNTGNVVRTCAVTGSELMLVSPLGFSISNRWLKRAGLDYWEGVNVQIIDSNFDELLEKNLTNAYFLSSKASRPYTSIHFHSDDWLVFGSETDGLPKKFFEQWPDRFITIPMLPGARCINLATAVGIVVYEAWRQQEFTTSFET
jgi:tRNA (cytidine/uridine-2'-O-)-methyltransferase